MDIVKRDLRDTDITWEEAEERAADNSGVYRIYTRRQIEVRDLGTEVPQWGPEVKPR